MAIAFGAGDDVLQAQAHFVQGMAAFHLGQDAVARDCMRRTLSLRPSSGLAHQWIAAIDALGGMRNPIEDHLAEFLRLVPNHTIESLRSTERSHHPDFTRQRARFYDGLQRAGLR